MAEECQVCEVVGACQLQTTLDKGAPVTRVQSTPVKNKCSPTFQPNLFQLTTGNILRASLTFENEESI